MPHMKLFSSMMFPEMLYIDDIDANAAAAADNDANNNNDNTTT